MIKGMTKEHERKLLETIEREPLGKDEFRRVEGLGGQFISLAGKKEVPEEFIELFTIVFGKTDYTVYAKIGRIQ
jgi:hypothetical protein